MEISRLCCCSVSRADVISSIAMIQYGEDAMSYAEEGDHDDTISVLEQVMSE